MNSEGRLDLPIPKIVTVLNKDSTIIRDWVLFYEALGVNDPQVVQWKREYNSSQCTSHELFTNILTSWQSQNGGAATLSSLCLTLREIHKVRAAEYLEEEFCLSKSTDPLWYNVGQVERHFVGRRAQLDQLQEIFNRRTEKIIVISGLGGIGKTELAKKFAHEIYQEGTVSVTWLNGETEESLHLSLVSLSQKIGIATKDVNGKARQTATLFTDVSLNLLRCGTLLVIFDNVDEMNAHLLPCLQTVHEAENVLAVLTSRNVAVAGTEGVLISLEEWERSEAIEFVKRSLLINKQSENLSINKLCSKLGNYALGMQQAVAYIKQQQRISSKGKNYSIQDYLMEFKEGGRKTSQLLDHKLGEISHKYAKTTFITWDISIAKIDRMEEEGKLALNLLNIIAYLSSNGIHLDSLTKWGLEDEGLWSKVKGYFSSHQPSWKERVKQGTELLKAYSLIKIENYVITVHRLVQQVIRLKLSYSLEELPLLSSLLGRMSIGHSTGRCEVTQVKSVWKYASRIDSLLTRFVQVPLQISDRFHDFGLYSELCNFSKLNEERVKLVFGENHVHTLQLRNNLGKALNGMGEWEKALEVYHQVWEKKKEVLGTEAELTLETGNNIGAVLYNLERYDEAQSIWENVLSSREKVLGKNHVDTLSTEHGLALVLKQKGELNSALGMFNRVLDWRRNILGETHPHTLITRLSIATCLIDQGEDHGEAKKILDDVTQVRRAQLGDEHPATLISQYWLAVATYHVGDAEQALGLLEQVNRVRTRVLGKEHPRTVSTQAWIHKIQQEINSRQNG